MASIFRKAIHDMATGPDGESYDPARLIGYGFVLVAANVWLGATIYEIWKTGHFDGTNFAISLAGVAAALMSAAGGVAFKSSTEPPASPPSAAPTVPAATPATPAADTDDSVAAGNPAPTPAATTITTGAPPSKPTTATFGQFSTVGAVNTQPALVNDGQTVLQPLAQVVDNKPATASVLTVSPTDTDTVLHPNSLVDENVKKKRAKKPRK